MFTFFHRRKKIVVDCFTSDQTAYHYAPIVRATKLFPDWWQNMPLSDPNSIDFIASANMKRCWGFVELYKRSIMLPLWSDYHFKISKDRYEWSKPMQIPALQCGVQEHNKLQYGNSFDDYHHAKLISPWNFREKRGINFIMTGALWHMENYDFKIMPGILEFKCQSHTNVNIFLAKKQMPYVVFLSIAKPLVYLTPLSEDKIVIKNHLVSENEMMRLIPTMPFSGLAELLKIKNKQESRKCPFGF
jgi:hypothetical protein